MSDNCMWWEAVYPFAIRLEKHITISPEEFTVEDVPTIIRSLQDIGMNIEQVPHSAVVQTMRENLLRAIEYLIFAYQEKVKGHETEVEYHYSSALMQVSQFHHQLVLQGFAD